MKLWQKISIVSLLFIMLAISITTLTVLNQSFIAFLDHEKQKNINMHESYEAIIINEAAYQRIATDQIVIDIGAATQIMKKSVE